MKLPFFPELPAQFVAKEIVLVSKNTSGTDFLPTIRTKAIVAAFLWIGSYFHRVVLVDAEGILCWIE